ncbi:MAG: hypothetical protein J3K34DRAFT_189387 [Monoraphidium minutum]|nr:MAG: hypothetical protein J3K34DRAFT_189387 [Monoraphidium minutum]
MAHHGGCGCCAINHPTSHAAAKVLGCLRWSVSHMRTLNSMQRLRSHPPFNARRTARAARSDIVVARMGRGPVTLVSFDIDGTLIRSAGQDANRLHKEAFSAGFQRVFGIDTHIDVVKHHGGTDPLIAVKVMMHHGIPKSTALERLPELEAAMTDHFHAPPGARGARGLCCCRACGSCWSGCRSGPDVATCLVTGNLEPIGWGKMTALGIRPPLPPRRASAGFGKRPLQRRRG